VGARRRIWGDELTSLKSILWQNNTSPVQVVELVKHEMGTTPYPRATCLVACDNLIKLRESALWGGRSATKRIKLGSGSREHSYYCPNRELKGGPKALQAPMAGQIFKWELWIFLSLSLVIRFEGARYLPANWQQQSNKIVRRAYKPQHRRISSISLYQVVFRILQVVFKEDRCIMSSDWEESNTQQACYLGTRKVFTNRVTCVITALTRHLHEVV
jgi:hypothetical protein